MSARAAGDRGAIRLDALLREQRTALRHGRLDVLAALVPRLERAVRAAEGLSPAEAARLRIFAAGNAALLRAALAGLEDVGRLRQGARAARLATYDASGRLAPPSAQGQTLARR